ncbi:hypothetical protein HN51_069713 [Arachis hypogaea]
MRRAFEHRGALRREVQRVRPLRLSHSRRVAQPTTAAPPRVAHPHLTVLKRRVHSSSRAFAPTLSSPSTSLIPCSSPSVVARSLIPFLRRSRSLIFSIHAIARSSLHRTCSLILDAATCCRCRHHHTQVNHIGTVTESIQAALDSKAVGWVVMVRHQSDETEDNFITDLSVGLASGQILFP